MHAIDLVGVPISVDRVVAISPVDIVLATTATDGVVTGAAYVTTACSNCKRQLTQLMEHHKEEIDVGGVHDMLSRSILINGKAAERKEYV